MGVERNIGSQVVCREGIGFLVRKYRCIAWYIVLLKLFGGFLFIKFYRSYVFLWVFVCLSSNAYVYGM